MANEPGDHQNSRRIMNDREGTISRSWRGWSLHIAVGVLLLLLFLLLSWSEKREMDMIMDEEPVLLEDEAGFLLEDRIIVKDGAITSDRVN